MIRKIHQRARTLLFINETKDWPYLGQVILLFLLVGFPIYGRSIIPNTVVAFDILFTIFIFYGILLLEKPSLLLLMAGIGAILILLFRLTGEEALFPGISYWVLRAELVLPLIYFGLLGIRLVRDALAQPVSAKLLYISIANYFTIGILFSFLFQFLHINDVNAFIFSPELKYNYLYMSFIILSTVGLGDLLPLSQAAKSAVMIESLSGQLYLTFFVAMIVGKYLNENSKKIPPTEV